MPLIVGSKLGPYEIVAPLGAGGMGEVYRARDTRLGREVAIKILPDAFATDSERVARFQREAQMLASLNHPNIAHIHGLEDAGSSKALVLELVDGPTLADLIAKGPVGTDEALPIAKQIAEALEAAHEHGIIHRDLKPANIKLTHDGTVKVLDFGLAKVSDGPAKAGHYVQDLSASPTITSPAMTLGGVILGTAAYMSPEQAKGKPVDRRTDMWAFGCVLFEMLSGTRAFAGEDVSDTLAEILKSEPDWKALPATTPAQVLKLIHRCLTKDRRTRFADAGMASMEIADAIASPAASASALPVLPGRKWRERVAWAVAGVGVLMAGSLAAILLLQRDAPEPQPYRLSVLPPENVRMGWAAGFGANRPIAAFALSPNGEHIAFLGSTDDAKTFIWVRRMDSLSARPLPGTDGVTGLFWSADSRWLGFFADTKLKKIAVDGGAPVTLCDAPANSAGSWSESGDILFASLARRGSIRRVSSEGGSPTEATTLAEKGIDRHGWPVFLPGGRRFLYLVAEGAGGAATLQPAGVFAAALDSSEHQRILERGSNVAFSHGHLLFVRDNVLMAQPFDPDRLKLSGEARVVSDSVASTQFNTFLGTFSVSRSGLLAHQTEQLEARARLQWFDRGGKPLGEIGTVGDFSDPELSPDGARIAASVYDAGRRSRDIWVYPARGQGGTRLTIDLANAVTPRWSPDGKEVFFSSTQKGPRDVYRKSSTGTGSEIPLIADSVEKNLADFSPDQKYALIQVNVPDTGSRLFIRPLAPDGEMAPLGFPNGSQFWGRFSPDGRWLAYYSDVSGRREVWVAKFPIDGSRWQVTTNGAWYPRWRRDGRELFYLGFDNTIYAVPVTGEGPAFQWGAATRLFSFNPRQPFIPYDVTADGQRFIVTNLTESQDTMPITVLVNWTAALSTAQR